MKFIVYYRVPGGTRVNRDYPDYAPGVDVAQAWIAANHPKVYMQHEPHDDYTAAFAAAGMVGADPDDQRDWLRDRVRHLNNLKTQAQQAKAATLIPGHGDVYGGHKPGDIVRDQHGRSGRVPNVELEVFRRKAISPDAAMDAVRDFCKGGGSNIPKGT